MTKEELKISTEYINKLKEFEGLKLKAYKCPAGVWTIGVGHTGKDVHEGLVITEQKAEELLLKDLSNFAFAIDRMKLNITPAQRESLIDFAFNCGLYNLRSSTLLKKISLGYPVPDIQKEFKKWVYAGKKVLPGLVRRRDWEAEHYAKK